MSEWLFKKGEPTWATWCPQQQVDQKQTEILPLPPPDQPPGEMESGNGQTSDDLCGAATTVEETQTKETAADPSPSTQPEKNNAAASASIKETKEKDTNEPADPEENETNEACRFQSQYSTRKNQCS